MYSHQTLQQMAFAVVRVDELQDSLFFSFLPPVGKGGREQKSLCQSHMFDYQTVLKKKLAEEILDYGTQIVSSLVRTISCMVLM